MTSSYVRGEQSKLSLNKLDVKNFLLPLLNKNEVVINGIHVIVYDIKGKEYSMMFKFWESRVYVLKEGWNMFCHKHSLREHEDFVTVWMFCHVQTRGTMLSISSRRLSYIVDFFLKRSYMIKFNFYQKKLTNFTISKELYLGLKYEP